MSINGRRNRNITTCWLPMNDRNLFYCENSLLILIELNFSEISATSDAWRIKISLFDWTLLNLQSRVGGAFNSFLIRTSLTYRCELIKTLACVTQLIALSNETFDFVSIMWASHCGTTAIQLLNAILILFALRNRSNICRVLSRIPRIR